MTTTNIVVLLALVAIFAGCDNQTLKVAKVNAVPLAGTNAGTKPELTSEVAGWSYGLMANQGRIAGYQFNNSGSVVATVGSEGRLDYPAMFWRIDKDNQIVIADERDFRVAAEMWTVLSIEGSVVTVRNAVNNREERYYRRRHSQPPIEPETRQDSSRNTKQ